MATSSYPYSFARRGESCTNLAGFMRQAVAEHPERAKAADWEWSHERTGGLHVTYQNFHSVVPHGVGEMAVRIEDAGAHLAARLAAFAIRFLEKIAGHHQHDAGTVPTANELMLDVNAMAELQINNPAHEIWKYHLVLRHPLVNAAVTFALNDRWNRPDLDADYYDPFFPAESEMIDPPLRRRRPASRHQVRARPAVNIGAQTSAPHPAEITSSLLAAGADVPPPMRKRMALTR